MAALSPLTYPEEQVHATKKSAFPYGSFAVAHDAQEACENVNRMQQLEQMLEETQGRAEIIEKEAYDKAYLAGEKAGLALGQKRAEQILDTVKDALKEADNELAAIKQAFAEAAMDLGRHIAEQIIGGAIESNAASLFDMAQKAAAQLPETGGLNIAISPDDYSAFNRLLQESPTQHVLSSNASVKTGTCRIISARQDILIDPIAAVADYLVQLRPPLLGRNSHEHER